MGLLICPDWWPNRSSFDKQEALFENKLSKKAQKNVFSVILTLSKSPAQSEAQTRETDDSDPDNPITRYIGSDPIFGRIRIPNSGNRFNRVEFGLGLKPTQPDPWTPLRMIVQRGSCPQPTRSWKDKWRMEEVWVTSVVPITKPLMIKSEWQEEKKIQY